MQTISIKSGASAKISLTPKINGEIATTEQMAGLTIYVFFVYQFTNEVYKEPYVLNGASDLTIKLSPKDTLDMLGNAEENQKYEIQFAFKTSDGEIVSDESESKVVVDIIKWEAGKWLNQQ